MEANGELPIARITGDFADRLHGPSFQNVTTIHLHSSFGARCDYPTITNMFYRSTASTTGDIDRKRTQRGLDNNR